jgi:hypothetical protein
MLQSSIHVERNVDISTALTVPGYRDEFLSGRARSGVIRVAIEEAVQYVHGLVRVSGNLHRPRDAKLPFTPCVTWLGQRRWLLCLSVIAVIAVIAVIFGHQSFSIHM